MNTDNITPNELLDEEPPLFAIASDENETVEDMENHEQSVQADEGISAEEVAELRDLGLSDAEIAEILGVESLDDELKNNDLTSDELTDNELIAKELITDESFTFGNDLPTNSSVENNTSEEELGISIDMDIDMDLDDDANRTVIHPAGMLYNKNTESPKIEKTDLANEEVVQEEVVQEEAVQEEVAQEEVAQEEVAQEEVAQEEVAQEEVAQEEVAQEEVAQEEPLSEIEELRGLGLSDEEICHILEIDSLDGDNSNTINDTLIVDKDNKTQSTSITENKAHEEIGGNSKLDNKHINIGKNVGKTAPALLLAYADKQFLTFPTQSLLELIESPELTALPSGKDFVYGLLHWQDKLVPVIDLALLLKERAIKTTTETNQPTQLSNELSSELSNKKVAFVMVTAYHTAEGIAHIAVKLDEPPVSVLVNNNMACDLVTDSDINWADYAISCFSYQNNPVPILQPEWLFV